jgi:hypothetical protein
MQNNCGLVKTSVGMKIYREAYENRPLTNGFSYLPGPDIFVILLYFCHRVYDPDRQRVAVELDDRSVI